MRCSVTVLGTRNGGDAAAAAGRIVDYLKGQRPDRGRPLQPGPNGSADGTAEPAAYYGDSAEGEGLWLGTGFGDIRLSGAVDREQFASLLLGEHPATGEQLISNAGSAVRAHGGRAGGSLAGLDPTSTVGVGEAAKLLGVGRSYVQKVVKATAAARAEGSEVPTTYLDASQAGPNRRWEVPVAELVRFAAERESQAVVLAYDVTFSCPKSVSLLWARTDSVTRSQILAAIESSVRAGMAYLEETGCTVKVGHEVVAADGFKAAGFLHATSRALDPQLHWHCVVLNATTGPSGEFRAIDARGLFAHAKTAGYLAAAQLRHELTARLGVDWQQSVRGNADLDGIERTLICAFSKRAHEIDEVAASAGLTTAGGRQAAALSSRAAKTAVDTEDLVGGWHAEFDHLGFTVDAADHLLGATVVAPVIDSDVTGLFAQLLGPRGLTELSSVFDRRDVVQAVAEWAGARLDADEICDLADEFIVHPDVVLMSLTSARPGSAIHRADGRSAKAGGDPLYTCRALLEVEAGIVRRYRDGFDADAAVVSPRALNAAIGMQPALGVDQAAMVERICSSGDRIQCVLGPAGSGKTFALEVATRAWESQGQRVVGVAAAGVAAEVLSRSLGIETTTVASLLKRLDLNGPVGVLDTRTVVLVDEASTIGTRDLANLLAWADQAGAAVRLVGDPAQHSAVAAGGMFRHLVERHPERVPQLTDNRRQCGADLGEVRLALDAYRNGRIAEALNRLDRDQRVVIADTADELLDALVADWYVDRLRRAEDASLVGSSMVAEHHFERSELNRRARTLLQADGTLHGPELEVAGHAFRAGDEVICRAQNRDLRPSGGDRRSFLRNGNRGTVTAIDATEGHEGLIVDFEGKGEVFVPRSFLEDEVRPQVTGGLTHAYALTSHASQGETYEAGRHLATDQSSREGVYVGLTRGRSDVRIYAVNRAQLVPRIDDDPGLPRLERETVDEREAVAARLAASGSERLATEHDRLGPGARRSAVWFPAAELRRRASVDDPDPVDVRAWQARRLQIGARARQSPSAETVELIGPRPGPGSTRARWDRAAASIAEHHEVHPDREAVDAVAEWSQIEPSVLRLQQNRADQTPSEGPKPHVPSPLEAVPIAGQSVGTMPVVDLDR